MPFLSPYADPNAHGSLGNTFSFRRTHRGCVLEKKPVVIQDPSPLQDANRVSFAEAVRAAKIVSFARQTIFTPPPPPVVAPPWARFVKFEKLDIAFHLWLNFPHFFDFVYQEDAVRGRMYSPHGFALIARDDQYHTWHCLGGQLLGDPYQYPWADTGRQFDRLLLIYGIDSPRKVKTLIKLRMCYFPGNKFITIYIHCPEKKQSRSHVYGLDWWGWMFAWQGQVEVWTRNI